VNRVREMRLVRIVRRVSVHDSADLKKKCICPDGSYGLFLIFG
jgi:hypothetical protein